MDKVWYPPFLKENKWNQHNVSVVSVLKSHWYPRITGEAACRPRCPRRSGQWLRTLCLPSFWLCLPWFLFQGHSFVLVITHPTFFTLFVDWVLPLTVIAVLLRHDGCVQILTHQSTPPDLVSFSRCDDEFYWLTHTLLPMLLGAQAMHVMHACGEGARIFWVRNPSAHPTATTRTLSIHWPVVRGEILIFSI